jgi:glucose-1-phosphate thymidylyltransferase
MIKKTKGIILAGGKSSRLWPNSSAFTKHLFPVFNKPMIYYSLSVLFIAKIRDILVICNQEDRYLYKKVLGNGETFGIKITYKVQKKPDGIGSALNIGKKFIGKDNLLLILGDNFFYGTGFSELINNITKTNKSSIFYHYVNNPKNYGVVQFDKKSRPVNIIEKPKKHVSNYAITGLYYYTNEVLKLNFSLKKSKRGEYEISDYNKILLKRNLLECNELGRGFTWFDMGTSKNILETSEFVRAIEDRQGNLIGCLEEIALINKWISKKNIKKMIEKHINSDYAKYIKQLL